MLTVRIKERIFPAMKFKHTYWNEVGCPVLVDREIGRTENAKRYAFSLTSKQKNELSRILQTAQTVLFDGHDYRHYTGMYGYPKSEWIAARFIVDGKAVTLTRK